MAFPRAKDAGANVNQLAITTDATGIHFYVVGFPIKVIDPITLEEVIVQNPCMPIGTIPVSVLENPFWFDQEQDGLSEGDYYNEQGDTSGRPTDYEYDGDDIDFPDLPSGASAHKRLIDIVSTTPKTMDALVHLEIPAGVDIVLK